MTQILSTVGHYAFHPTVTMASRGILGITAAQCVVKAWNDKDIGDRLVALLFAGGFALVAANFIPGSALCGAVLLIGMSAADVFEGDRELDGEFWVTQVIDYANRHRIVAGVVSAVAGVAILAYTRL